MQPTLVRAEPDTRAGRVAVHWVNPVSPGFSGVRVLRREQRFPDVPGDIGTAAEVHEDFATPAGASAHFVDAGLRPETTYYYAIVALDGTGAHAAFTSSFATAPYRTAELLYESLPELYRLHDTSVPPAGSVSIEDAKKGQLRRFVDLLAEPFELLRSAAASTRTFHDLENVDAKLLPLLAEWIGESVNQRLDLPRQRRAVRFAPHYFRTLGIAANLRAAINRLSAWDARLKEFVHNVLLSNHPEELALRETTRESGIFSESTPLNHEVAHCGRAAPVALADGRLFVFYHARATPARDRQARELRPSDDEWHLFCKIRDAENDLASLRLTHGSAHSTHPAAVALADGSVWLFSTLRELPAVEPRVPARIGLHVLSAGGPALRAKTTSGVAEPFALADGDRLIVSVATATLTETRTIVARAHHFADIGAVTALELARLMDGELPHADVKAMDDGRIEIVTRESGAAVTLGFPASPLRTTLGLVAGPLAGRDGFAGELRSRITAPFALADGDTLVVKIDGDEPRSVIFREHEFADITLATAPEVVAAIERTLGPVARVDAGRVVLTSPRRDEGSLVLVDSARGAAAPKLGFGAPLPISPNGTDDENPAVILDGSGNVWAFWASRRRTTSNLWYARSDGSTWSAPKALTAGLASDREPSGAFDPSGGGRIWIAFTRRKPDGRSNIFVRTTTVLDFNALVDSDFQETEITPVPPDYDNRESALIVTVAGGVELFMASNRTNGWNVWTKTLTAGTPLVQGGDSAVTTGQETQRCPVALLQAGVLRLWFRSNAPRTFVSSVYPLTRTFDGRYSGSTSADTRNPAKQSRRRELEDLGRYVYDTGEGVTNLFARGTVGVYLTPDTDDQMLVLREQQFLADALRRIVPIQVRLVFLIETGDRELVYTYDFPNTVPDRHIGEVSFESILPEMMKELTDAHVDGANVRFLRTWVPGVSVGGLPDLAASPPDLAARLYTAAFEEEE